MAPAAQRRHGRLRRERREQRDHRAPARPPERRPDRRGEGVDPGHREARRLDADGGEPRPPRALRGHAGRAEGRGRVRHRPRERPPPARRQRSARRQPGLHRPRPHRPLPPGRVVPRAQGHGEPGRAAGHRAAADPDPARLSQRALHPRRRGKPPRAGAHAGQRSDQRSSRSTRRPASWPRRRRRPPR